MTRQVVAAGLSTPADVVSYFIERFYSVPVDEDTRAMLAEFFAMELGTNDVQSAVSYLEDPLRVLLHVILSRPEYQLG